MLKTKPATIIMMCITKSICSVVKMFKMGWGGNDFNYFIFSLRDHYPDNVSYQRDTVDLPFIKRSVLIDDEFQKCIALKIGDCIVEYTHKKVMSEQDFYEAVIYDFENELNFKEIIGQAKRGTLKIPTLIGSIRELESNIVETPNFTISKEKQ